MKTIVQYNTLLLLVISIFSLDAQVPLSFEVENRGTGCSLPAVANNQNNALPDPFAWANGNGRVNTFDDWSCRRNEIKSEVEYYEIGPKPVKPTVSATYSAGTLRVTVSNGNGSITLSSSVTVPSGSGPHPVVIGMNRGTGNLNASLFNGVIQVAFMHDQVVAQNYNGQQYDTDPFYKLYPELWGKIGNYNAWSWGISRIIDGLEQVKDQINADVNRIAVTGCSYAGKMALFAGAFDERIALTIAQESGGGGITSWRVSNTLATKGYDCERISNTNYSWFKYSMSKLDPFNLPYDHHELIAMIAPRAFLALGNYNYTDWLGDQSGVISCLAAHEVWNAMGVGDRFGYDFAGGHQHCTAATSQNNAVTAFVDKYLRDINTANTDITNIPFTPIESIDTWKTWTIPEITVNTDGPVPHIASPVALSVFKNAEMSIVSTVDDPTDDVSRVEFYINDIKIGEDMSSPYSIDWIANAVGMVTVKVVATDAEDNKGTATMSIDVREPQGPYGGTVAAIPGKIELENFDVGGQDSAYFDTDAGTNVDPAPDFRTDEDVDIEVCNDDGGGYNLGWTAAGEWTEYTVDVAESGTYKIVLRAACNGAGRTVRLESGGNVLADAIAIPDTKDWQTWQDVIVEDVELVKGSQVLRMTITGEDYVNLNYMTFINDNLPVESVQLSAGWNLVGYPLSGNADLEIALSAIWEYVDAVKNNEGFYLKDQDQFLSTLDVVSFGKGYLLKVNAPCKLIWNAQ